MRTVLGFTRMSKAAYAIVRRAVEDDEHFRDRVAASAEEAMVGRAGWLWLHRPHGWDTDPAMEALEDDHADGRGPARLRRERDGAEAAAARHRQAAIEADESRRRAVAERGEARQEASKAQAEAEELRRRLADLEAERNGAVRTQKRLEADLAAARRDLKLSRAAARQAEADLLAVGRASADPTRPGLAPLSPTPVPAPAGGEPAVAFDRPAAQEAVAAASGAAVDLARALADVAAALAPPEEATYLSNQRQSETPGGSGSSTRPARVRDRGRPGRGRPRPRTAPTLPPATIEGSAEANRFLVTSGRSLLLVDGYNLARAVWSGLEPEEERRRTVALLEEVRARSGAPVTVVFDGEDATTAPAASRSVRVQFSTTAETADDAIAELLRSLPPSQPVVVVSSDREVADDARRQGAVVLGSRAFLTAAGR